MTDDANGRTLPELIEAAQLTITAERIPARLDRIAGDWDKHASHWIVTIGREGRGHRKPVITQYSMGSAHKGTPTLPNVVHSLMRDAECANDTFADFCANCGYDTDSRRALDVYLACQGIGVKMRRLLGSEYEAIAEAANEY